MVRTGIEDTLRKLLQERLKDFEVPHEVRDGLVADIIGAIEAPSKKRLGATVMTAEASRDADRERKHGANKDHAKPRVV